MRSAAPASAISAPSLEPGAMMMPASPRMPPAPLLNALATTSAGRPAMKVPWRMESKGGRRVTPRSRTLARMAARQQKIGRVSWVTQASAAAATEDAL